MAQEQAATVKAPLSRPILAGIVTALVGVTSAFAVVLAGLHGVGANDVQAASGLLTVCVTMGLGSVLMALRFRMPIIIAWSTPGAAVLAATGTVDGGWPAAVGAFVVTGGLILLTAAWPGLGRLIGRIPPAIAQAMLAGVLLPLCLAPIAGAAENPWGVLPVLVTWLICVRFVSRWAVPLAFVVAAIVITVDVVQSGTAVDPAALAPVVTWTAPAFTVGAVVGLAIPLFVVTMASQNVPGVAVMRSFGYDVPWRSTMLVTGVGTLVGAASGGHAINLAAISAALAAGPEADPDPQRRWVAGLASGIGVIVLGAGSAALVALVAVAPVAVIPAVAGVALFAIFGSAVAQAASDASERLAAVVTFLVAASGLVIAGIGAAFWALVAGLVVRTGVVRRPGRSAR
jgi:benzoate membrane transport protein